jgi:hypothetical protein
MYTVRWGKELSFKIFLELVNKNATIPPKGVLHNFSQPHGPSPLIFLFIVSFTILFFKVNFNET